jgi:hypothetical protein
MDIFDETQRCLQAATRKLTYFDINESDPYRRRSLRALENNIVQFEKVFGFGEFDLVSILQRNQDPKVQMQELRRFLITSISNCFAWLVHNLRTRRASSSSSSSSELGPENKLQTLVNTLREMRRISSTTPNCHLNVQDKLSFVNVAFAHPYQELKPLLSFETCDAFCQELILANVDFPEPYFFYTCLHWPTRGFLNEQEKEFLPKCQVRLKEMEGNYPDFFTKYGTRYGKPRVLFYMKQQSGRSADNGANSNVLTKHEREAQWVHGNLDEQKNVEIPVRGPGAPLRLRADSLIFRGRDLVFYVKFKVGFTFAGPVAFQLRVDVSGEQGQMRDQLGRMF